MLREKNDEIGEKRSGSGRGNGDDEEGEEESGG